MTREKCLATGNCCGWRPLRYSRIAPLDDLVSLSFLEGAEGTVHACAEKCS